MTFHFQNNNIPKEIIRDIGLEVSKSKLSNVFESTNYDQKEKAIKGFVKSSQRINKFYFATKKGFKLGDNKDKAIEI